MALKVTQEQYDRWQAHLLQSEGKSINNTHPRKVSQKREEEILREYSRNNGVLSATTKSAKCCKKTLQIILKSRGLY
jgi:ActR/RegA family two-component response regulator